MALTAMPSAMTASTARPLDPSANNSVIEYYISASDQQGASRTWPAPAIPAADQVGPPMQSVNALFQVDDTTYTGTQPIYKLIMTEIERGRVGEHSGNQLPTRAQLADERHLHQHGYRRH
jgi:hypothetical protein